MKKVGKFICNYKKTFLIITLLLLIPSFIGMKLTKINYDILVYLPDDIETVKGQNILTNDFDMGAFSTVIIDNMSSNDILKLESKIRKVDGVAKVVTGYDLVGNEVPIEMLPNNIRAKLHNDNTDVMLITFDDSTSSERTLNAVSKIKEITKNHCRVGGMSAMALDTMNLSEREITIYIVIAVLLCIIILELSLDSYAVPFFLLTNIGIAILFNLGSNIIFGEISYITKALVAVLQLGVTTDFSIFLYHSYEDKKKKLKEKEEAMAEAISETFTSVIGSSLTTIAGFLVLCTMKLTLGKDLGLVMAKGVLLGVICTLIVFPVLLLYFDKLIQKTKHKEILPKFDRVNKYIIKHNKLILVIFIIMFIPMYLANSKVNIYYKLDNTLPNTLDSISSNKELKEKFNIVSPEIILISKDMKENDIKKMVNEIKKVEGVDFILSEGDLGLDSEVFTNNFESDKYKMLLLNSTYDIATNELNNQVNVIQKIIYKYDKNGILAGEGPLMKDLVKISDVDFKNVNNSSVICILIIMLFVLKSYTLPILLILVIEFAIFTNMAIPYFSGEVLPFVAPIVLGTIQLGATIDYAILMTTTYLKERTKQKDKEKAIINTMNKVVPSIIVSGLCFFGATFGVGVYSKLEMISSLCKLISRGAIISMLFVICILPSILLTFDKVINNTMFFKKGEKNMKNKAYLSLFIITLIMCTPVKALTKDETVYVKLNNDGSTKSIEVTEKLINNTQSDEINDISNLENILNVSGNEKVIIKDNSLTWKAGGNDITYRGTINKSLPISTSIKYYLDDKEMKLEDILGKKGKITIVLNYQNNDKHYSHGNTLYTPFVVTTGMIIDGESSKNVTINNGKVINNGSNIIVIGLATPGLSDSLGINNDMNKLVITLDTDNFELPSIYSIVNSKIIDQSDLKIFNKVDSLYSSMNTLSSSINKIEEGAKSLYDGSIKVNDGATKIYENLNTASKATEEIKNGTITLDEGLKLVLSSLNNVKASLNNTDTSSLEQINTLLTLNSSTSTSINDNMKEVKEVYDSFNLSVLDNKTILGLTKEFYQSINLPITTDEEAFDMNIKLINVKYIYENAYENNTNISKLLTSNNTALNTTLTKLQEVNTNVNTLISTLETNISKIEAGANSLKEGTEALDNGVKELTNGSKDLALGTNQLSEGAKTLSDGINKFNDEGIKKLESYVYEVETMETKVKDLQKLGENYNTFTMTNSDSSNTKFIMVIDSVKKEEIEINSKKEITNDNILTRIKKLFK